VELHSPDLSPNPENTRKAASQKPQMKRARAAAHFWMRNPRAVQGRVRRFVFSSSYAAYGEPEAQDANAAFCFPHYKLRPSLECQVPSLGGYCDESFLSCSISRCSIWCISSLRSEKYERRREVSCPGTT
jgi:hypothetical protein